MQDPLHKQQQQWPQKQRRFQIWIASLGLTITHCTEVLFRLLALFIGKVYMPNLNCFQSVLLARLEIALESFFVRFI